MSTRSHFRDEGVYWRDVYTEPTIEAAVYNTRLERAMRYVDALGLPRGASVLEIGCGGGWAALAFARRGFRVCATDLVAEMLPLTEQTLRDAGQSGVVSACCDAQALPFPDHSFDLVAAFAVMEWVPSEELALAEMLRVLRPGGAIVLSATNVWGLHRLLDPRLGPWAEPVKRRLKKQGERARSHSAGEIQGLLRLGGLDVTERTTAGYGPFTFLTRRVLPGRAGIAIHQFLQRLADRGVPLLGRTGFAHVVIARKPAPTGTTFEAVPRELEHKVQ